MSGPIQTEPVVSSAPAGQDIQATGYSAGLRWCLRCDVAWTAATHCWVCGQDDFVWRWAEYMTHHKWRKVK